MTHHALSLVGIGKRWAQCRAATMSDRPGGGSWITTATNGARQAPSIQTFHSPCRWCRISPWPVIIPGNVRLVPERDDPAIGGAVGHARRSVIQPIDWVSLSAPASGPPSQANLGRRRSSDSDIIGVRGVSAAGPILPGRAEGYCRLRSYPLGEWGAKEPYRQDRSREKRSRTGNSGIRQTAICRRSRRRQTALLRSLRRPPLSVFRSQDP